MENHDVSRFHNHISQNIGLRASPPYEEASTLCLQPDHLRAKGQITLSHKEHAGVALQSDGGKVTHSLPFALQRPIDVFLQKQLPFLHKQEKQVA